MLEFSASSAFFWGVGLFLLLGWIFVLGIFVGRGFLPRIGDDSVPKGESPLVSKDLDRTGLKDLEIEEGQPKLEFYKRLTEKKEQTTGYQIASEPQKKGPPIAKKKEVQVKPSEGKKPFTVQVASFLEEKRAKQKADQLRKQGYSTHIQKAAINGKTYFRVRSGRFEKREEAQRYQHLLARKEGLKESYVCRVE